MPTLFLQEREVEKGHARNIPEVEPEEKQETFILSSIEYCADIVRLSANVRQCSIA